MAKTLLCLAVGLILLPSELIGQRPRGGGGRGMDVDRMMSRYDTNADGKLTKVEVGSERMWRRMASADKDEDGFLSRKELEAMGGGRGRSSEAAWKFLADKYDADKDGVVSAAEYTRDASTFTRLDRNKDGVLTAEDWAGDERRGRGGGASRPRSKAPEWGQMAPDFELTFVRDAKQKAKLSSYIGDKPVALIFGSCT
jgi:hypothetical protein